MSLPDIVKALFSGSNPSNSLWNLAYSLIGIGVFLLGLCGYWIVLSDTVSPLLTISVAITGAAMAYGGFMMTALGEREIPANPRHFALPTIWGERQEITLKEQDAMTADFWPLKIGIVLVPAQAVNEDFCFKDVPCRASVDGEGTETAERKVGAKVNVEVSVTYFPNPGEDDEEDNGKYLVKYMDHGFAEGVTRILRDALGQAIRDTARDFYWEEFTLLKQELTVLLLQQISVIDFRTIPDKYFDADGNLKPEANKLTPDEYKHIGSPRSDLPEYLFARYDPVDPEQIAKEKRRRQEIEVFLKIARENDVADGVDLGIKLARLNVTKILSVGKVGEAADEAASEDKQRERERKDMDTVRELADRLVSAAQAKGDKLPYNEALAIVRSERGKLTEHRFDLSGVPIADLLAQLLKGKVNG
jgi:hypothetical protein